MWYHSDALICLTHLKKSLQADSVVHRASDHPEQALDFGFAGLGESWALHEYLKLIATVHHLKTVKFSVYGRQAFHVVTSGALRSEKDC